MDWQLSTKKKQKYEKKSLTSELILQTINNVEIANYRTLKGDLERY